MNESDALIAQLRDVQTPVVSIVPAAGWWVLLLILIVLAVAAWLYFVRYQKRGWQREAKAQLNQLREQAGQQPVSHSLSSASKLTRQVLLAVRPRTDVAGLQGQAWLDELDRICGQRLFADGYGKLLEVGPYQRTVQIGEKDLSSLFDVIEKLIDAAGSRRVRRGGE